MALVLVRDVVPAAVRLDLVRAFMVRTDLMRMAATRTGVEPLAWDAAWDALAWCEWRWSQSNATQFAGCELVCVHSAYHC